MQEHLMNYEQHDQPNKIILFLLGILGKKQNSTIQITQIYKRHIHFVIRLMQKNNNNNIPRNRSFGFLSNSLINALKIVPLPLNNLMPV